ncbi:hypothetical protein FM106_24080 [Brachybacterium faecium]|nr:hypothetical protein FM106_24080 [Brachybacterium faecium]
MYLVFQAVTSKITKKHYPDKLRQNSVLSNSDAIAMLR